MYSVLLTSTQTPLFKHGEDAHAGFIVKTISSRFLVAKAKAVESSAFAVVVVLVDDGVFGEPLFGFRVLRVFTS